MTQRRINIGKQGERLAQEYLRQHAYAIIQKNFRCKSGEIDIAKDREVVVFIEVRTQTSNLYGPAYNTDPLQTKAGKTGGTLLYQPTQSGEYAISLRCNRNYSQS